MYYTAIPENVLIMDDHCSYDYRGEKHWTDLEKSWDKKKPVTQVSISSMTFMGKIIESDGGSVAWQPLW